MASSNKSQKPEPVGDGYKVVTTAVQDLANPCQASRSYSLVGYCSLSALPAFSLDPPRGKQRRVAVVLLSQCLQEDHATESNTCFQIHKVEHIEPDQVENAIKCFQSLRTLTRKLGSGVSDKRTHSFAVPEEAKHTKKARCLQAAPTDVSLDPA